MPTETAQLNVGILGCGPIAQAAHFESANKARNATLHAICDVAEDLRARMAATHAPKKHFSSYDEMLADPELDAVIVATSDAFHVQASIAALKAGKHVLCEKPLGVSVEEVEELRKVVKASGKVLQVGNMKRFDPGIQSAKAFIDGEMGEMQVGLQARLMSQALRKMTSGISRTNTCVIFINQIRMKIGVMFGNPETTTGGNALKFYASVRLDVRSIQSIKGNTGDPLVAAKDEDSSVIGKKTKVKVVKNKVAPPLKIATFDIMYGEGISRLSELVELGTQLEIIQKSGSWFSYKDSRLGQGAENVKKLLADNPELADEVETQIRERIGLKAAAAAEA